MTSSDPRPEPVPEAPGYGDQGPAGGGRDREPDAEEKPVSEEAAATDA